MSTATITDDRTPHDDDADDAAQEGTPYVGPPVGSHEPDDDPEETQEWVEALSSVAAIAGRARAKQIVSSVLERARRLRVAPELPLVTDFVNTIAPDEEPEFPGDEWMEKRIRRIVRWNAMA